LGYQCGYVQRRGFVRVGVFQRWRCRGFDHARRGELSTWAHELVHAADHRLTRLKGQNWHGRSLPNLVHRSCSNAWEWNLKQIWVAPTNTSADTPRREKPLIKCCMEVLDNTVMRQIDPRDRTKPQASRSSPRVIHSPVHQPTQSIRPTLSTQSNQKETINMTQTASFHLGPLSLRRAP